MEEKMITIIHIFLIYLFVAVGLDCLNDSLKRKPSNKDEQQVKEQTDIENEIKNLQKQLADTRAYLFLLIVCFALFLTSA